MKRINLLLLAVLFSITAMAQKTIVTGILKDSIRNTPTVCNDPGL